MLGIGIETSCDETSAAIVKNGVESLANVVYSQISEHAPYRGVVPEIASRSHLEKINFVCREAFERAEISPQDLDYIAVTHRPGLIGSLMIGAQFARCLSLVFNIPIIAVNHLEAHFYAAALESSSMEYPFLGLLLSGGNSVLYRVEGLNVMEVLADTRDDALGEAFDKAAAILDLPYPGGPSIEKKAEEFSPEAVHQSLFPRLLKNLPGDEVGFSFSGIKTAVLRAFRDGQDTARIAFDFQNTVFELVERMLLRGVRLSGIRRVIASGGVLANGALRHRLRRIEAENGLSVTFPDSRLLCTDNGGMVAALGYALSSRGDKTPLDFSVSSKR